MSQPHSARFLFIRFGYICLATFLTLFFFHLPSLSYNDIQPIILAGYILITFIILLISLAAYCAGKIVANLSKNSLLHVWHISLLVTMLFYLIWLVLPGYISAVNCVNSQCTYTRPLLFHETWPDLSWQIDYQITLLSSSLIPLISMVGSLCSLLWWSTHSHPKRLWECLYSALTVVAIASTYALAYAVGMVYE